MTAKIILTSPIFVGNVSIHPSKALEQIPYCQLSKHRPYNVIAKRYLIDPPGISKLNFESLQYFRNHEAQLYHRQPLADTAITAEPERIEYCVHLLHLCGARFDPLNDMPSVHNLLDIDLIEY